MREADLGGPGGVKGNRQAGKGEGTGSASGLEAGALFREG